MLFRDRVEAGIKLAKRLEKFRRENVVVLAIPRGGVVVGFQVAKYLNAPLDIVIPRKLGALDNPELAIGAISQDGSTILNQELIKALGVSNEYIELEKRRQLAEIKRRLTKYRGSVKYPDLKNKVIILVDDGIATGATVLAAVKFIKKLGAKKIVVATPVAPPDAVKKLRTEVDEVITLETPELFFAIGQFYEDFEQISDEEVIELLKEAENL